MRTKQIKTSLIYITITLIVIVATLVFSKTNANSTNKPNAYIALPKELSKPYQEWEKLTQEQKQNTIMPNLNTVNISDFVKKSTYRKMASAAKVGGTDLQYNLYNDCKFRIKNQLSTNECWAFATTTILETNMLKMRNKDIELSPRHIDYATSRTFLDGINDKGYNREIGFGNIFVALGYCTSGRGPVLEKDMPFENNENKVNLSEIDKEPVLKVQDYTQFASIYKNNLQDGSIEYSNGQGEIYTENQVLEVRKAIKEHIKQYGGVTAYTHLGQNFLNCINVDKINSGKANTIAYYNSDVNNNYDHAITIVGWDDTYAVSNFNAQNSPKGPGAYICLNSSSGENNVFSQLYISYEDVWIESSNTGIINTTDIDYDKIYQHDEYGYDISLPLTNSSTNEVAKVGYMANVFSREEVENKDEFINEISIYIPSISSAEIYVNAEDDDKSKLTKVAFSEILMPGYHTIKFTTPVKLTGNKFIVAAKLSSNNVLIPTETNCKSNGLGSNYWDNAKASAGESFISLDGNNWNDISTMVKDSNICIKAFTTYQEKEKTDINVTNIKLNKTTLEMLEGEIITLVSTIEPSNATNKNVSWKSDNEEIVSVTKEGIISAKKQGNATITVITEDGNKQAICKITVKGKIDEDDDIYYPDDNNNQNNDTPNTDNPNNKPEDDKNVGNGDNSLAPGTIPQTGVKIDIIILTITVTTITAIIYIKIRKIKEI